MVACMSIYTYTIAARGGPLASSRGVSSTAGFARALAAALWAGFSMTSALATGAPLSPRFAQ